MQVKAPKRLLMINAKTIPTFILGNPIEHSLSPDFQNPAFQASGVNSVYLALNIEKANFADVVNCLKKIRIFGLNITLPYKNNIIKFCDELTQDAKEIGSVNTVEIINNRWIGHNTDWHGVLMTLRNNNIAEKEKVLIIGAGGASNAVIYGIKKHGISDITITNKTAEKAEKLKDNFKIKIIQYSDLDHTAGEYSMIINCTTLPFDSLVQNPRDNTVYFDLKYYTKKLDAGKYIDGLEMLLYQGMRSFSIWTKKEAPLEIMKKALGL
jgi:shikimate dehydrogenase